MINVKGLRAQVGTFVLADVTFTVPTGGYRIEWADMRVAESYPVQIFAVPVVGRVVLALVVDHAADRERRGQPERTDTARLGWQAGSLRHLARRSPSLQ